MSRIERKRSREARVRRGTLAATCGPHPHTEESEAQSFYAAQAAAARASLAYQARRQAIRN